MEIYPIKFMPILKEKVWGGDKLKSLLNKSSDLSNIGESWELSGVKGNVSVVSNGVYEFKTLMDLINEFKQGLLGSLTYERFGDEFPLLFKFIDATDDLSIQLHPDDELAKERHNSFGKTEMWYVLDAERGAKLYAGLSKEMDEISYLNLKGKELLDVVYTDNVKKDEAFFIKSGTIHAIGKGILLAEIQQTSDVTYRIYDWGRLGLDGEPRELHNDIAVNAIDFSKVGSCKLSFENKRNLTNEVYSCEYFTTNKLVVQKYFIRTLVNIDSFIVYMCVSGTGVVEVNGNKENISKGETILIPAICKELIVTSEGEIELLEVYIK